ncbi:RagB/SusD family nutrient uptake outer membrane protein [Chitinophaga agrisoli]|nr:RagB/SusD family nutrient uptake outer membrane protein [Chitinophaga agrisoli]
MQRYYKTASIIHRYFIALCILCIAGITGCKDFVQVDPPITGITKGSAYDDDKSALAVLTGIYSKVISRGGIASGERSIGYYMAQYADELQNWSPQNTSQPFYVNALQNTGLVSAIWNSLYQQTYVCNAAIEGITAAGALSADVKNQTLGEARLMRAFLYLQLVNLFGDVPMPLSTDYNANNTLTRSPQAKVYEQIVQDLQTAQQLLSDDYKNGNGKTTTDKGRPNKQAAAALLARVYLYLKDWQHAAEQADAVLGDSHYALAADPVDAFPPNSQEAIWQMAPISEGAGISLGDPQVYLLTPGAPPDVFRPVSLSTRLLNAFETGDKRFAAWVGVDDVAATGTVPTHTYYYPKKYKLPTGPGEYCMIIRLAEVLLIRAEARAQLNNLTGAKADLDAIRTRAGLGGTTAATKEALLDAILHERQVELFTEWGHRWFDLKRAGKADAIMSVVTPEKGGVWSSNWLLWPIPQSEILLNDHLSQNPGYPN